MRKIAICAGLTALCTLLQPAVAASSTFCTAKETTYFNCVSADTVASLCGKDDASSRYLQYRFGHQGRDPELLVPKSADAPDTGHTFRFNYIENEENMFARTEVSFRAADKTYQLTFIERLDVEGRAFPQESDVLSWPGEPAGAPEVMKCSQPKDSINLYSTKEVIEKMEARSTFNSEK